MQCMGDQTGRDFVQVARTLHSLDRPSSDLIPVRGGPKFEI
jgi:hypothetical protein